MALPKLDAFRTYRGHCPTGTQLPVRLLALIMAVFIGGCRDKDADPKEKATPVGPSEPFLEVITDPAQVKSALELAAESTPVPLSAEALADVWVLSPDLVPADMLRDEAASRLNRVIQDRTLPMRTRCTAAGVLTMMDSDGGQKAILELLQNATGDEKHTLLFSLSLLDNTEIQVTDGALIAELISYVKDPDLAVSAVWICARLKLPRFQEMLWQHLPESKGAQKAEILFWLADTCPSRKVFTECAKALPQLEDRDRHRCLVAMTYLFDVKEDNTGEDATEAVAAELLDLIEAGKTGIFDFPQSVCAEVLGSGSGPKAVSLAQAVQRQGQCHC